MDQLAGLVCLGRLVPLKQVEVAEGNVDTGCGAVAAGGIAGCADVADIGERLGCACEHGVGVLVDGCVAAAEQIVGGEQYVEPVLDAIADGGVHP